MMAEYYIIFAQLAVIGIRCIMMKISSHEKNARSIVKTITYRIYQSFIVSPLIVYFLSGDVWLSFKFGITEFIVKIPAYYLFERIWALIRYGYKR